MSLAHGEKSKQSLFGPNSSDPDLSGSTIPHRISARMMGQEQIWDTPPLPQYPEHLLTIPISELVSIDAHHPGREGTRPTPILEIRQTLIRSFRLHNDRAIPARVDEKAVATRDRDARGLGVGAGAVAPLRALGQRSDDEGGAVHPAHNIMIGSLGTT